MWLFMNTPVGIVLVSHGAELAAGLRLLVEQIGSDAVPVVTAAGTEDGRIGTSYDLVLNAIKDADRGAGGPGSSRPRQFRSTTRTVLDDHPRPDVVLVDAPFVEGAVAAVVTAASGADLHRSQLR
jgi:PTS hybrid protein